MDATAGQDGHEKTYVTPRWVQAWFLRRSRDNWKRKYVELKADEKRLKNRVNDVTRSRENWRKRVEELEAENAALRKQAALKKSGRGDGVPTG
jgi:predicted nuclease with TOPRIM domain